MVPTSQQGDSSRYQVIAVDDEEPILNAVRRFLRSCGFDVHPYTDPRTALGQLEADPYSFDLMLLDVNLGVDVNGLDVLHRVKEIAPELPVVMLTADDKAYTALSAVRAGAFDYIVKPLEERDKVESSLAKAGRYGRLQREYRELKRKLRVEDQFSRIIGNSRAMREVFAKIDRAAKSDAPVLILGESGTGKELVAREIYENSDRSSKPFVVLNCGALPESLIDSQLFGHVKGAFTGANTNRTGTFDEANGGTVFLDEIGELPKEMQPRLLRVLQEGEVMPVGSSIPRKVDVRVIAATNQELEEQVEQQEFRQDLYYRLNVFTIGLPPLRSRMEDVPLLVKHFVEKWANKDGRPNLPSLTSDAYELLMKYRWPGNVRQLENAIRQALAYDPTNTQVDPMALPDKVRTGAVPGSNTATMPSLAPRRDGPNLDEFSWVAGMAFREVKDLIVEKFERGYVEHILIETKGNVSAAARYAGLDRANFRRLYHRLGINPDDYRIAK